VADDGVIYRIDPDHWGDLGVWRWVGPDDPRPRLVISRPLSPDVNDSMSWIVWRAVLAGLGLEDVQ
jgi:hypothetical protein